MGKAQQIAEAIALLEENGYLVRKDYSLLLGKWVAFQQEGMDPILHGKVVGLLNECLIVKCKNGEERYPSINSIIDFFDNKQKCYSVR